MNEPEIMQKFVAVGAIISDSHFVYTSGRHGSVYVNKDALYVHPEIISALCQSMVQAYDADSIDVVVAPVLGGIILSQWVAHALNQRRRRNTVGTGLAPVRNDDEGGRATETCVGTVGVGGVADVGRGPCADPGSPSTPYLSGIDHKESPSETLAVFAEKSSDSPDKHFHFTRGYHKYIPNKNILIVEDILATGSSVRQVIELVRQHNGNIIGVSALCNRGHVQPHDIGHVPINALIEINLQTYAAEACPLCKSGIPINTELGKGRAFLAKKA